MQGGIDAAAFRSSGEVVRLAGAGDAGLKSLWHNF